MALLSGGFSRVAAAVDNGRGAALSMASQLPSGDREQSWAFSAGPEQDSGGMELAQALGPPEGYLIHRGSLEIVGQLPRASRDFSPHSGDNAMFVIPPVYGPSITFSSLIVSNADDGTGNMMGDQGYAMHVKQGVSRFDGPIWAGNWVYVDGVGNVQDRFAGDLGAGIDEQYYYIQGRLCEDSKGRKVTDTPVTLFCTDESALPSPGDVVLDGLRDRDGVAWGSVHPGSRKAYGKITTAWSWVTSYENSVGRFYFNPCRSPYGSDLDATRLYSAVALAGPGTDPNGQKDTVFGYSRDSAGNRLADTPNVFDDKIGTIKDWGSSLASIPKGWALVTSTSLGAGQFLVGYKAGSAYDPPGTTGGNHPITPTAHSDLSGIDDHAANTTDTAVIGITVDVHPEHYHKGLDDGRFVNRVASATDPGNDSLAKGQTDPNSCPLTSATHTHELDVGWFSKVGFDPDSWLSDGVCNSNGTGISLTHTVNETPHLHTTPVFAHTGTLVHSSQDFRPPFATQIRIIRVGPA